MSLVFDARPRDSQREAWRLAVLDLFAPNAIVASLANTAAITQDGWMCTAVAKIRSFVPDAVANLQSQDEYMRVLAVYLLRHASFHADNEDDEYRRSFAFWLACRLTEHLEAMTSAQAIPV